MLFFSLETTTADFKKEYYITKKFKIIHSKNNLQYFTNSGNIQVCSTSRIKKKGQWVRN